MTELLEKRIAEISESVANGIVVQADAQFLLQMLVAIGDNVVYLKEENEKLKLERDAAVECFKKIENYGLEFDLTRSVDCEEAEYFVKCVTDARDVLARIDRGEKNV